MNYAAVITAGGRVDAEFEKISGTPVKALAPMGSSTLLHIVIGALRGAGIERIAVVGGSDVRAACATLVERVIDEGSSGEENQRRALHAWDADLPLVYATSDMPFITATAVRDFLDRVPPQTIALPLTAGADFDARFPGAPRFGVTLARERVVNGGLFALPAGSISAVESLATEFFTARKSVWKMAALAGPALVVRLALRRLSVSYLERRATELLGIRAQAVRNAAAELAYDTDTAEEYRYARSIA